jgi:hypothetical protein
MEREEKSRMNEAERKWAEELSRMTEANRLRLQIDEILLRAYYFDDKPHQLFSGIRALALKHPSGFTEQIVRLMDEAYEGKWSYRATPKARPVTRKKTT